MSNIEAAGIGQETTEAVTRVGELLIQAAATIGTLSKNEREQLESSTGESLEGAIRCALQTAAALAPSVAQSLKRNPPTGFNVYESR